MIESPCDNDTWVPPSAATDRRTVDRLPRRGRLRAQPRCAGADLSRVDAVRSGAAPGRGTPFPGRHRRRWGCRPGQVRRGRPGCAPAAPREREAVSACPQWPACPQRTLSEAWLLAPVGRPQIRPGRHGCSGAVRPLTSPLRCSSPISLAGVEEWESGMGGADAAGDRGALALIARGRAAGPRRRRRRGGDVRSQLPRAVSAAPGGRPTTTSRFRIPGGHPRHSLFLQVSRDGTVSPLRVGRQLLSWTPGVFEALSVAPAEAERPPRQQHGNDTHPAPAYRDIRVPEYPRCDSCPIEQSGCPVLVSDEDEDEVTTGRQASSA